MNASINQLSSQGHGQVLPPAQTQLGKLPAIAEPVIAFVVLNFAEEIELDDLAREAGMSRFNFCRRFHEECGVPPMRWLWSFRISLAAEMIGLDPTWSLTDVAFACGFSSSAHFSRTFRAAFGQSPSAFRKAKAAAASGGGRGAASGFDQLFTRNSSAVLKAVSQSLNPSV